MPHMATLSQHGHAPKYTLRGRASEVKKTATPGPGNYSGDHQVVKYGSSPKYGFGGSSRESPRPSTAPPGPGAYSPPSQGHPHKQVTTSHRFGTGTRRAPSPSSHLSPGPGAYQHSPRVGNEGPKFSAGGRREVSSITNTPGPAAYAPASDPGAHKMGRMPQHSFSRSTRNGYTKSEAPGPGQYNSTTVHQSKSQEYTFGGSGRKEMKTGIDPGPGSYQLGDRFGKEGPAFSAGSRAPRDSHKAPATLTPGPGAYNHEDAAAVVTKFGGSPKFGFGSASRDGPDTHNIPGPGQYSPAHQEKASPRHGFGSSTRAASSSPRLGSPGPGAYTLSPRLGSEGPKFTASGRRDAMKQHPVPGPGAYQDAHHHSAPVSPRYGFGSSTRSAPKLSMTPGPGNYDGHSKDLHRGHQHSFGSRNNIKLDNGTPGPGAHDHTSQWG